MISLVVTTMQETPEVRGPESDLGLPPFYAVSLFSVYVLVRKKLFFVPWPSTDTYTYASQSILHSAFFLNN
jgi:hypothetical protein